MLDTIKAVIGTILTPILFITVLGFVFGIGVGLFSIGYQLAGAITSLLK